MTIERLWRRNGEPVEVRHARQHLLVDEARRRDGTARIMAEPLRGKHPVIDERVGRAGIECDHLIVGAKEGDISHAAEIENSDRPAKRRGERTVIDGKQRRPLPARRDVRRSKVGNHRDAERTGEHGAVADLPCPAAFRPMRNGLAVEADDVGGGAIQQRAHRFGVQRGDLSRGIIDNRVRAGRIHAKRTFDGGTELFARVFTIGNAEKTERADVPLAVRFDERGVDSVHRRARHQADRAIKPATHTLTLMLCARPL